MDPAPTSLAEALFGRRGDELSADRAIAFDQPASSLSLRRGEAVLELLEPVEDAKGNPGQEGELTLTNLRLMWAARRGRRTNLSVGLGTITSVLVKPSSSRLRGATSAVYVLTRQGQQRFEFIFTPLGEGQQQPGQQQQEQQQQRGQQQPHLAACLQVLLVAYEASRPYRELRLRGALLLDKELKLLPRETAYSRVNGVWNLSSEAGNLGALFITNVRLVWHSTANAAFNVSIPFLQVKAVRVADSKFGVALVVETSHAGGGYVLGFRVEPRETLDYVHKEISSLLQACISCPDFGVEYSRGGASDGATSAPAAAGGDAAGPADDADMLLPGDGPGDAWAAYCADEGAAPGGPSGSSSGGGGREPVFSEELGLAVEAPREGLSISQLWSVLGR